MSKYISGRTLVATFILAASSILLNDYALGASTTVPVFQHAGIQFGGNVDWNQQPGTTILDNGRIIERTLTLPELGLFSRVTANLTINADSDPWDRAGSIYVSTTAGDVELHKFITSFGGSTNHQQDITNLIPILNHGPLKIRAFIDTWVQTARTVDFSLTVTDESSERAPSWGRTLFNDQDWRAEDYPNNKIGISVRSATGLGKIILSYLPSGHAIDGNGGDEFTQRTHHVFVDGVEVWQGVPWRTDGRDFRSVNPTSGRFGDIWSSDLDRAGWIPGDDVDPILIDVTQYLTPGAPHRIEYQIDGIRSADANGYGYWRTSSYLTGFAQDAGPADFNYDGVVDGGDFLIWQRGFGQTGQINNGLGDADRSGTVDSLDLAIWQSAFSSTGEITSLLAVPEPGTVVVAGVACFLFPIVLRRTQR